MSQNIPLHQYLDVETLFQEKNLEDIVNIEKLLEVEIERKRRDLRSMVGDRYRDILGASDAIKSMEIISQNIVENIDNISFTSQALVNNPLVFNQDQSEAIKQKAEERSLIIQLRLAVSINNQIWNALEEGNNLNAAQCCLFAQHIQTGLDLTRRDFLNRIPVLVLLKRKLGHLRTTIFEQISAKLETVHLSTKDAIYNLNAQMLLESRSEVELLETFIKHRDIALDAVLKSQHLNVRVLMAQIFKYLTTTICLFYDCFTSGNLGRLELEQDANDFYFTLPQSALTKYLPDIITQFRPKIDCQKSDKTSLNILVHQWLAASKEAVTKGLVKFLERVTSVNGLWLVREECLKIDLPLNWDKMCLELDFTHKFEIWHCFFEDLLVARAKNLVTDIIMNNSDIMEKSLLSKLDAFSSNSELDLRTYVWLESNSDFDKEDGSHRGLTMKSMGFSNTIVGSCKILDQQYSALLSDVTSYLYESEGKKHLEQTDMEDHLITTCYNSAFSLLDIVTKISEKREQRDNIAKLVFCARFLQSICELCPNMKKCSELNGRRQNWCDICDKYMVSSNTFWKHWIENCVESTLSLSKSLCNFSSKALMMGLYRWDIIETQEHSENKIVKSQLKIPLKPSVFLVKLLEKLNYDLCQIVPHTLRNEIHSEYLERNGGVILRSYNAFIHEDSVNQIQVLQLLFDVRFLESICIPRENSNIISLSRGICDELRGKIDPFDLDVSYAHLQANVRIAINQSQVIYGCLFPTTTQLSELNSTVKPKTNAKFPSILATSNTSAWFHVLPIRGPVVKNMDKV